MSERTGSVKIVYSYKSDEWHLLRALLDCLEALDTEHLLAEPFYAEKIHAGSKWKKEYKREAQSADIVVLMVSVRYMDAPECQDEMHDALTAGPRVIPVRLEHTDGWDETFGGRQVLPTKGNTVRDLPQHPAFLDIAAHVLRTAGEIHGARLIDFVKDDGTYSESSYEWIRVYRLDRTGRSLLSTFRRELTISVPPEDAAEATRWKQLHTEAEKLYSQCRDFFISMMEVKAGDGNSNDGLGKELDKLHRGVEHFSGFLANLPEPFAKYDFVRTLVQLPNCISPVRQSLNFEPREPGYRCGVRLANHMACWLFEILRIADRQLEDYFRNLR